jgi:hypothetical protein
MLADELTPEQAAELEDGGAGVRRPAVPGWPQFYIDLIIELRGGLLSKGLGAAKDKRQCCRGSSQRQVCGYSY